MNGAGRQLRQLTEIDAHTQCLLMNSPEVRREFMRKLDTSSLDAYRRSSEWYREYFAEEVIGRFDQPLLPPNVRTRKAYDEEHWAGYEVGSTFHYAEMAALIAPRPFMVERGHFDGVAPDETVAWEFAKVNFLYAAKLGLGDRCEMETFVGPHTINGQGTFDFLHRHLRWPK